MFLPLFSQVAIVVKHGGAAASPSGRTLELDATVAQENLADVAPSGFSAGDMLVVRDHLRNAGSKPAPAGKPKTKRASLIRCAPSCSPMRATARTASSSACSRA